MNAFMLSRVPVDCGASVRTNLTMNTIVMISIKIGTIMLIRFTKDATLTPIKLQRNTKMIVRIVNTFAEIDGNRMFRYSPLCVCREK